MLKSVRLRPLAVQVGLALAAGLLTWGVTGTAMAAGLSPLIETGLSGMGAGVGAEMGSGMSGMDQNCSGILAYALDFDSMLFQAQTPSSAGLRAFDIAFMAVVALIVITAIRFRHATTHRRLELARRMVDKGIEPPPELLGANNGSDLRRGLVLVFTGVGLLLASILGGAQTLSPAGLIPGFIGVGYLVSHRFAIGTAGGRS